MLDPNEAITAGCFTAIHEHLLLTIVAESICMLIETQIGISYPKLKDWEYISYPSTPFFLHEPALFLTSSACFISNKPTEGNACTVCDVHVRRCGEL